MFLFWKKNERNHWLSFERTKAGNTLYFYSLLRFSLALPGNKFRLVKLEGVQCREETMFTGELAFLHVFMRPLTFRWRVYTTKMAAWSIWWNIKKEVVFISNPSTIKLSDYPPGWFVICNCLYQLRNTFFWYWPLLIFSLSLFPFYARTFTSLWKSSLR